MKCYFCQNLIVEEEDKSEGPFHPRISESCENCAKTHNLHEVITVWDDKGDFLYAHIYPTKQEYGCIPGPPNIPGSNLYYPTGDQSYHIRLNIQENTTYIGTASDVKEILTVPGLPIKPENAKEKLKLYILFS